MTSSHSCNKKLALMPASRKLHFFVIFAGKVKMYRITVRNTSKTLKQKEMKNEKLIANIDDFANVIFMKITFEHIIF